MTERREEERRLIQAARGPEGSILSLGLADALESAHRREDAWNRWITRIGNSHDWLKSLREELPEVASAIDAALDRDDDELLADSRERGGAWYPGQE